MRHFLRRITLFPWVVVTSPYIYTIAWLLDGHESAATIAGLLVAHTWGFSGNVDED